jgi:hypothetical protein
MQEGQAAGRERENCCIFFHKFFFLFVPRVETGEEMLQISQQISQQLFMFGNGSSCANNSFTCTRTSARAHARVPRCMQGPILRQRGESIESAA